MEIESTALRLFRKATKMNEFLHYVCKHETTDKDLNISFHINTNDINEEETPDTHQQTLYLKGLKEIRQFLNNGNFYVVTDYNTPFVRPVWTIKYPDKEMSFTFEEYTIDTDDIRITEAYEMLDVKLEKLTDILNSKDEKTAEDYNFKRYDYTLVNGDKKKIKLKEGFSITRKSKKRTPRKFKVKSKE